VCACVKDRETKREREKRHAGTYPLEKFAIARGAAVGGNNAEEGLVS
jgi:hypothetical protein